MQFNEWLKSALQQAGINASQLADKAKIAKASACFYVSGQRLPGEDALNKICAALNVERSAVPAFERKKEGAAAHRKPQAKAKRRRKSSR